MTDDPILTIAEVAQLLKVAEKTVYVLAQRHKIPAFKVGGQWRFSKAALDAWIAERSKGSPETDKANRPDAPREDSSPHRGRRR